jgi:hypothetical protein
MKSPQRESSRSSGSDADHKWVSSDIAELRQQEHGVQVARVIALGVEFHSVVDRLLEDAQQLRCDLFAALHGRLNSRSFKLSGRS